MKTLHFAVILVHMLTFCYADTNEQSPLQCSEADDSAKDTTFQTNLRSLLDSLLANGPLEKGFYKTKVGKKSERVFGLVQCRGDVSANDCANCTRSAVKACLDQCPKSKKVLVWSRWCFLRYSDYDFFGVMDKTSFSLSNDTDFDDPNVVSKALDFMSGLAFTVQKQPLLFQTGVLDGGSSGKRYGMVQCTRDISSTDCGKCLQSQLSDFRTTIGNKRGWEVYGTSCFMWYHDDQFYFNISTSTSEG
ncbi:hypothetical protein TIFTF001_018912 [Ficus carica]|uniref:Gnk2-homologous domain-containing protein n=1 Tax=Ficus carica TaxID=3494 RepID=A0AA88DJB3_FICCA|nr:hypothetical protein TIFTF001_018912 [Ficus carica]